MTLLGPHRAWDTPQAPLNPSLVALKKKQNIFRGTPLAWAFPVPAVTSPWPLVSLNSLIPSFWSSQGTSGCSGAQVGMLGLQEGASGEFCSLQGQVPIPILVTFD